MNVVSRARGSSAAVAVVVLLALGGCGGQSSGMTGAAGSGTGGVTGAAGAAGGSGPGGMAGNATAAMRAACYPPCLANLVQRCPLVSACMSNLESSSTVALPGESGGVAACFSTGERERTATNAANQEVVYVKAPDGSECYAAVGDQNPGIETWDLSVGGQIFGYLTWNLNSGAVAVTCDGVQTQIDVTRTLCQGLPWQNTTACSQGTSCTFGSVPAPGAWDAGAPCDPTLCASPPADKCQVDSLQNKYSVVSHGTPTCTNAGGCMYPQTATACDHGCYMAQCTGALASVSNVQGTSATGQTVAVSGGGAPAGSAVTVRVRTSPRGAASGVTLKYGTCTSSTLCILTGLLVMSQDPNTPAGQTAYDQWMATIPAQSAGTVVQFQLYATDAGDSGGMLSEAAAGTSWSYTSN